MNDYIKVFRPKGQFAIAHLIGGIFFFVFGIVLTIVSISEYKNFDNETIMMIIACYIFLLFMIYYSLSLLSTKIIFKEDKATVKGQLIIYRKRIQHSYTIDLKNINKITDSCDNLNSLGKKYSIPERRMVENFIVIHMNNGEIYRIWTDFYSSKQINQIINLLKKYVN